MPRPNFIDKLNAALPGPGREALDALTRAARAASLSLYAVGGSVRDLLLERPTLDLDLTLVGDAPALARDVAAGLVDVRCTVHPAFRTATLKGAGFRIDVASARAETYERPGALPTVRPGSLRDDLRRRDFTANAIALALSGDLTGGLIDPFNGKADLEAGLLRVLHEASFRDDATRILRGVRYEARLGFRFEPQTLRWLRRDVRYLETISGARIREELVRIHNEPDPWRVLQRLDRLGALSAIHPRLSFDAARARASRRLRGFGVDVAAGYFSLLAWGLTPRQATALAERLSLTKPEALAVRATPQAMALEKRLACATRPSRITGLLSPLPFPAVWTIAAAAGEPARSLALRYIKRMRNVQLSLDGDDLLALGAPPGPRVGEVMRRLKAAKLDGEVRTRRDEERLARQILSRLKTARTTRPRSS